MMIALGCINVSEKKVMMYSVLSELLLEYNGKDQDEELHKRLWEFISSDLNNIHLLLGTDFVAKHLPTLPNYLSEGTTEQLLVWFSIMPYCQDILSTNLDVKERLLPAILDVLKRVPNEQVATRVTFQVLNGWLSLVGTIGCSLDIILERFDCIISATKYNSNNMMIIDFIYLLLTHQEFKTEWVPRFYNLIYESGLLFWLNKTVFKSTKLLFVEALFSKHIQYTYDKRIQSFQLFCQDRNINHEIQYVSPQAFTELFDPLSIKKVSGEVLAHLNIELKIDFPGDELKILVYFLTKPIDLNQYLESLDLLDTPVLGDTWITPSRNFYQHLLKTHAHEFTKLQVSIQDFFDSVRKRLENNDGSWSGVSKYALPCSQITDRSGESSHPCSSKEKLLEFEVKLPRKLNSDTQNSWGNLEGKNCILLNKKRERVLAVVQKTVVRPHLKALLHIKPMKKVEESCFDYIVRLNDEIELKLGALDCLLHTTLEHHEKHTTTTMDDLVPSNNDLNEIILSNVFSNSGQLGLLGVQSDEPKNKKLKQKLINSSVNVALADHSYTTVPLLNSSPPVEFTREQITNILRGLNSNIWCIDGLPGSGKSIITSTILDNLYSNNVYSEKTTNRILVICDTLETCQRLGSSLQVVPPEYVVNLSDENEVPRKIEQLNSLLKKVQEVATALDVPGDHGTDLRSALAFKKHFFDPIWKDYQEVVDENSVSDNFLFKRVPFVQQPHPKNDIKTNQQILLQAYLKIIEIFEKLDQWKYLVQSDYKDDILISGCDILFVTKDLLLKLITCGKNLSSFSTLVFCNIEYFQELDFVLPLAFATDVRKLLFVGAFMNGHVPFTPYQYITRQDGSSRLLQQFDTNPEILKLTSSFPPHLIQEIHGNHITGFQFPVQVIQSPSQVLSNNVNTEEAEYCVLLYAYMRLLGYPSESITILTTSDYQSYAIETELQYWLLEANQDKSDNQLNSFSFGKPHSVATLEKNCANRNDYIIVSTAGKPLDLRMLSRYAKKGLFVLNNEGSFLKIALHELYPDSNPLEKREYAEIVNLAHLESYIKEMTETRMSWSG